MILKNMSLKEGKRMIYVEPKIEIVEFDINVLTMDIGSSDSNSGDGGGSTVFPIMQTESSDI